MADVMDNAKASPKAASLTTAPREASANSSVAVTPPNDAKTTLCKFRISSIVVEESKPDVSFHIIVNPSKHGLYDIIETAFDEFQAKNWTHKRPYSHLFTCDFNKKRFKCQLYLDPDLVDCKEYECNERTRRVLDSQEMESIVGPLKKGMKGRFSFDQRELSFQLSLDSLVQVADHAEYKDVTDKPMRIAIQSKTTYTAGKDNNYVSPEDCKAVDGLSEKYATFYKGYNGWSRDRSSYNYDWKPAKPTAPDWSPSEIEIIGLFQRGGWKFAAAWKHGFQYAFPHRAKTACQGKWYSLQKNSYMTEYFGRGLSDTKKILCAKKRCKAMMEEKLAIGAPTPEPKPQRPSLLDMW